MDVFLLIDLQKYKLKCKKESNIDATFPLLNLYFCALILSMQKVLVLGAGRSSSALIRYLLEKSTSLDWTITVADQSYDAIILKTKNHPRSLAVSLNIYDEYERRQLIEQNDIIVSLMPPQLHELVAIDCLELKKSLVTASYVSPAMKKLNDDVKNSGLLFLFEMGLDPGIDHMSAMYMLQRIAQVEGKIQSFKSYTGGLVATESDNNPWHYKITWNPRNVVLAGQGVAQFLENGIVKYTPYQRLFLETEKFNLNDHGKYEGYANRDSLPYIELYGLEGIQTMKRGTFRRPGFCKAWNALVQLGLTDDSYKIQNPEKLTISQWLEMFVPSGKGSLKKRTAETLGLKKESSVIEKMEWMGLFSDKKIEMANSTPAQILQSLMEASWKMEDHDKDLVIMHHEIGYEQRGEKFIHNATFSMIGEDSTYTAMAKTVGLPLGIVVKLILQNKISLTGVQIPTMPEIYEAALEELKTYGVSFDEETKRN
jgi:saccharopine dehydrogenase-like NADP-dependent oxidoreductase